MWKYLGIFGLLCLVSASSQSSTAGTDSINAPTEQSPTERGYVLTKEENEDCNDDPKKDVDDPFSCPAGKKKIISLGSRRCVRCQFDDTIQTFQPTDTHCDTCILCSRCKPGEEVIMNCTTTKDTECQPIVENGVTSSTTDEIPVIGTTQLPKHPTSETESKSSEAPDHSKESEPQKDEGSWRILFFAYAVPITLIVVLLLCFICWLLKRRSEQTRLGQQSATGQQSTTTQQSTQIHPSTNDHTTPQVASLANTAGAQTQPGDIPLVVVHRENESQTATPRNSVRDPMENGTEEELDPMLDETHNNTHETADNGTEGKKGR